VISTTRARRTWSPALTMRPSTMANRRSGAYRIPPARPPPRRAWLRRIRRSRSPADGCSPRPKPRPQPCARAATRSARRSLDRRPGARYATAPASPPDSHARQTARRFRRCGTPSGTTQCRREWPSILGFHVGSRLCGR
jgi:hypothetical protein